MVTNQINRYLKKKSVVFVLAVLLAVPFANLMDADFSFSFWLLLLSMLAFWRMVAEDAEDGMIELRYILVLVLGLFLCSHYSADIYLFVLISSLILFRMMFLLINLWRMFISPCKVLSWAEKKTDSIGKLPFLPCFAGGILCFLALIAIFQEDVDFIWGLNVLLDMCVAFLAIPTRIFFVICLLIAEGILELAYRYLKKKRQVVNGFLGIGDVVVLPNFAAFLGGGVFLSVIFFSLFIALAIVVYQKTRPSLSQQEVDV